MTVPPHWIDAIALQAAREIAGIPVNWPEPRRKAATQIVVISAIRNACRCGVYCQDIGGDRCRYQQLKQEG